MKRRQAALAKEGIANTPETHLSQLAGADANTVIIDKLRSLNGTDSSTSQLLDLVLSHVEEIRAQGESEDSVREDLDKFLTRHPALLKELQRPEYAIADLPQPFDQLENPYDF